MRCDKNQMLLLLFRWMQRAGTIGKRLSGWLAPEHDDEVFFEAAQFSQQAGGEGLPSHRFAVTVCLTVANGQDVVQQKNALHCPRSQVAACHVADGATSAVLADLGQYVAQTWLQRLRFARKGETIGLTRCVVRIYVSRIESDHMCKQQQQFTPWPRMTTRTVATGHKVRARNTLCGAGKI